jgi:hypothetical protein
MRTLIVFLALVQVAMAQSASKLLEQRYGRGYTTPPKPTLKPVRSDVREIGGTNYNVHVLEHWLVNNLTNAQPLVDWRELKAEVVQVTADGLLLERTVEPRKPEPVLGALTSAGGSTGGRDNSYLFWRPNGTPQDFGDLFFLVHHPDNGKLVEGTAVRALAMRVGNYKFKDTKGAERTIAKFDFGKPVTPATNAPARK